MGVIVDVSICCDACSEATDPEIGSVARARKQAKKEGFVRRKRDGKWVDLCSECVQRKGK